jgi:hypothetical protein
VALLSPSLYAACGDVYCGLCRRRLIFTRRTGRHGVKYDYFASSERHRDFTGELAGLAMHRSSIT